MIAVILEFDVIEGKEAEFRKYWLETTQVIYKNFGSLGSRLHSADNGKFIAYAQWPNHSTYEKSQIWPDDQIVLRDKMRATLVTGKPTLLYKLDVDSDSLQTKVFE